MELQNKKNMRVEMKRFLSLLLLLTMIFIIFAACGNDETKTDDTGNTEKETETVDLDGYEFVFEVLQHYGQPDLYPEENFSNTGDLIRQRYRDTEKAFNIVMDLRVLTAYTAPAKLTSFAMSGEKYADLLENHSEHITPSLQLYLPFDKLNFDDDKWGSQGYLGTMNFGGEQFGVVAYYWGRPLPAFASPLFFIPRRMNELQLSSPFELIEKKEWTWANFEIMLRAFTQTSDVKSERKFGIGSSSSSRMIENAIASNGAAAIKYDAASGKYVYGLDDPAALEAMEWVIKLIHVDKTAELITEWWEPAAEGFIKEKYGFNSEYSHMGFLEGRNHFALEIKEDYHWAPFPVGPKGTHGQWAAAITREARFLAMPVFADAEPETTQMIMEYLFRPLDGQTENTWKEEARREFFFDNDSFKYYMEMVDVSKTDYSNIIGPLLNDGGNSKSILYLYQTIVKRNTSPVAAVDKIKETIQARLDETLNNPDFIPGKQDN